jgi:hypothetical protein
MRNVGGRNIYLFKQLLQRKFQQRLDGICHKTFFTHNFSNKEPTFKLTVEVHACEFEALVASSEVEILEKRLERLQRRFDDLQAKYEPKPPPLQFDDELPNYDE